MLQERKNETDYSKELDEEIRFILEEYRDGHLSVYSMLKLIDVTCREHMDFKIEKNDG
jgi:hypothetical protein